MKWFPLDSSVLHPQRLGKKVLAEQPIILVGFNNPLVITGGLGTVMRTTFSQYSHLQVICHDVYNYGTFQHLPSRHTVHPIKLSSSLVEGYQRKFCKLYLWPHLHEDESIVKESCVPDARTFEAVEEFSEQFARQVAQVAEETFKPPVLWFNDYSMVPVVQKFCRYTNRKYAVGISIRSSFGVSRPPVFDPITARMLSEGICGADFVSVHRSRDAYHLLEFIESAKGDTVTVHWDNNSIASGSHRTGVGAIPMGSSEDYWNAVGRSDKAQQVVKRLAVQHPSLHLILSVSRLEQHKGIELELEVIERLLRYFPHLHETFVFCRIMPVFPEYNKLPQYQALKDRIETTITRINSLYGNERWQPISLISGPSLSHEELAGYYRAADTLMVLSNADGFNHVSVEAVLTKQEGDKPLALVLSDTGSSDYLHNAFVRADPRSSVETSLRLALLVQSDPSSRIEAHQRLRQAAAARTAGDWTEEVLGSIAAFSSRNESNASLTVR